MTLRLNFVLSLALLIQMMGMPRGVAHESTPSAPLLFRGHSEFSRFGFGYLGATSEAQANAILNEECPQPSPTTTSVCLPTARDPTRMLVLDTARVFTHQRLQETLFEWAIINQFAFQRPQPTLSNLSRPSCISADSPIWRRVQAGLADPRFASSVSLTREANQDSNLAFVLLHSERLNHARARLNCDDQSETRANRPQCRAITQELARMHASYPAVWPLSSLATGIGTTVGTTELSTEGQRATRRVYEVLGARGTSSTDSPEVLENRGRSLASSVFSNPNHIAAYSGLIEGLDSSLSAISPSEPVRSARLRLAEELDQVRERSGASNAHSICQDTRFLNAMDLGASINQIALMRPILVRQMLLDLPPSERRIALQGLCSLNLMQYLRSPTNCDGVRAIPGATPARLHVERYQLEDSWPYFAPVAYDLVPSTSATVPAVIHLPINLVVSPEDSSALINQLPTWSSQLNNYLNCQTGALTPSALPPGETPPACPPDPNMLRTPPVQFQVTFHPVIRTQAEASVARPALSIHRCYHSDILDVSQRSNCVAVRNYNINRCLTTGTSRILCEQQVPPEGAPENNRADAEHITLNSPVGVLRHEVGHLMGLPDEYTSPPYNRIMNPSGEHDSLMNSSTASSRLYPRHIDRILSPSSCNLIGTGP